jgi:monoamine oxidase
MEPQSARFIIVGAGIAGIQAALNLASMGQEFILLEAQGRVGGRICTLTIGQALKEDGVEWEGWLDAVADVPVEVGATWACEDNKCIRQLVDKYKIVLDAQYYDGNHILALSP